MTTWAELTAVVLTYVVTGPDLLVVESWHAGRGHEVRRRT